MVKEQQKLLLTPEAREVLKAASRDTDKSISVLVEELVMEVLKPELEAKTEEIEDVT